MTHRVMDWDDSHRASVPDFATDLHARLHKPLTEHRKDEMGCTELGLDWVLDSPLPAQGGQRAGLEEVCMLINIRMMSSMLHCSEVASESAYTQDCLY